MYSGELFAFDHADFETFDTAIGEMLIRKVLHKLGYNQRELILDPGVYDEKYSSTEMIISSMEVTQKVFHLLGYSFGEISEEQIERKAEDYNSHFYVDVALPELDGWSAQRLNRYRKHWQDFFTETRYNKPYYKVRFKTTRERQSVLRFKLSVDDATSLYFDLPTLIENFMHWREDMLEVLKSDLLKRQIV